MHSVHACISAVYNKRIKFEILRRMGLLSMDATQTFFYLCQRLKQKKFSSLRADLILSLDEKGFKSCLPF